MTLLNCVHPLFGFFIFYLHLRMAAQILDGKKLATEILVDLKARAEALPATPGLAVIVVGMDPASASYVGQKKRAAEAVGIHFEECAFPETVTTDELLLTIAQLNHRADVHGFIVQLPLPAQVDKTAVLAAVNIDKDVDGFHPGNHGQNILNIPTALAPATPAGIMRMLDHYKIDLTGQEVVVVGHSNIVGKPMAMMLINRDATVTVCHQFTRDLAAHTKNADIVISATGVPGLIQKDMIKKGAIIVDVGCSKVKNRLVGDVDFEAVEQIASYITPVPGGVGPMTVAMLMEHVIRCAERADI